MAQAVYGGRVPSGLAVAWSGAVNHTQFDVYTDNDCVYLVFAGSNEAADWLNHCLVRREEIPGTGLLIHRGWLRDWQACIPIVYAVMREQLRGDRQHIWCVGHSYGGALAQIAAWYLAAEDRAKSVSICNFASPRAGNKSFAVDLDKKVSCYNRIVLANDPVPHLPLAFRYSHGGTENKYPSRRLPHHMASYIAAIKGEEEK